MTSSLRQAVQQAYRKYLDREPEGEDVIDHFTKLGSEEAVIRAISTSLEAIKRLPSLVDADVRHMPDAISSFDNYSSTFDAEITVRRHQRQGLRAEPDRIINFIGAKSEEAYIPSILKGKANTVEPLPIPANWHADLAEWAAVLRAVEFAQDTFVVAELGCGWGCWITNAGVAARNYGLAPFLIGVEGDEGHLAFARRCCSLNGFSEDQVRLHHGIAAAYVGKALFPKQEHAGEMWGLQPVFGANARQVDEAMSSGRYDELSMISLDEVIGDNRRLDLLHIDIQGGEADLVAERHDLMVERVAYMFVGTHSRAIEGQIISTLTPGPWRLEIERPAVVALTPNGPVTHVDGVQGWRNMQLLPHK